MATDFYGAAVVDFSLKGGFGSDINLDVNVVPCDYLNDQFSLPIIGSPALFQHENWSFYGILDTYKKDKSSGGNPTYSVLMNNGQFILGGVELILNDYYGSANAVPNLINVFGYLENYSGVSYTGEFGDSNVNSAGMSWVDIASGLVSIVNDTGVNAYGNGITYKGYRYRLDISALPQIPSYYRINSDNINLIDFVSDICSAGGHDYFFDLQQPTGLILDGTGYVIESGLGWDGTFRLNTISRIEEPTPGRIDAFIEATQCSTAKNYGQEIRKDVYSKFVVGANLERLYFNYPKDSGFPIGSGDNSFDGGEISESEYGNDNILPFFGVDADNNVIIGRTPIGEPNEYYFDIDVSDINLPVATGTYETCLGELKAARKGRSSWERYLCERDCNEYIIQPTGTSWSYFKTAAISGIEYNIEHFNEGALYAGSGMLVLPKYGYIKSSEIVGLDFSRNYYPTIPGTGGRYLTYNHNNQINGSFQKATRLKIPVGIRFTFPRTMESDLYPRASGLYGSGTYATEVFSKIYQEYKETLGTVDEELELIRGANLDHGARVIDDSLGNFNENKTDQLYRRIKGIADTYYNKKFMVSIPFTLGAYEPESLNIRMSQDVINEGYLDESAWATAYDSGLIPNISGINTLLTPDNKFYPFVKYENCVILDSGGAVSGMLYDFSEIGQEDKIFNAPVSGSGGTLIYDCWVKCRMEEKIYFQDSQTLFGPRAVIEIPGSVKLNKTADYPSYARGMYRSHTLATGVGGILYGDISVTAEVLKKSFDKIGGDDALMHGGEDILYADLYAVPLRSKLLCYGPWYAIGADGKVSYERNEELNPWNYGGFDNMNTAGYARVNDGITNQTFSEVGSVTVVGAPTLNFGQVIISGGPYVTDINCSFGSNGITTTYNFQAWSSHRSLSKLQGYSVERTKRLSGTMREIKSNYREGLKNGRFKNAGDFFNKVSNRFIDLNDYTRKERSSTSHKMFGGEINGISATVVAQPLYNAGAQAYTNFGDKAFMSMDGLLRPFSTVAKSGWPSFITPETTGEVDVYSINPFISGHNVVGMSYGSGVGSDGLLRGTGEIPYSGESVVPYRALGLRLPAVGVGWGFDVNGQPVPSGTGINGFAPDYLYNMSKHKAGPIDLRWDEDRGVWGSVPTNIYLVKTTNLYTPACFSFEVDRSTTQSQYNRNAPTNRLAFSTSGTIHDPEYLAYTGNPLNIGCYEQLDYSNIEYPYYEAFIIRKTNDDSSISDADYNIWYEDCSDCGHVTNQCDGYTKHDSPSARKKVLIENPLRQSFNAGDLAFTVDTGKKKRISNSTFVGGSGAGASGHFTVDTTGTVTFSIDAAGSGYTFGAFAVYAKPCVGLTLTTTADAVTGYTLSGTTTNVLPTGSFAATIYPKNATADYDLLPIHWVLQAEFKSQQFVSHVECDNGILQSCTVKVQTQGFKSCESCGESTSLVNNFM